MKKIIRSIVFLFIFIGVSFSQIDDILKKIPGVGEVFKDAVTTSIKDAYPTSYWLRDLDKQISLNSNSGFSVNLSPGYYRFRFNTFCLHAGTYGPTEGDGYLVAPLKGAKANLIISILGRSAEHPEIDQKDVQLLIWGIEAGQKFSNYSPDFQLRVQPLLKADEIALMEVDVKDFAVDLLPQEARDMLNLYSQIRNTLSSAGSTYEDVERLAVRTGIAPKGKGSRNIGAGTWTSLGDGVYMRCFPERYSKTEVEIYIPEEVSIAKDNTGNIVTLENDSFKVELQYETAGRFKSTLIKNIITNEETSIDNTLMDDASIKKDSDEFIKLVKKSFGKKKSKRISGENLKTLTALKKIEKSLSNLADKSGLNQQAYLLSVNAVNNFVAEIETGTKKGGGRNHKTGLSNINGLVFAPANTSKQRLGNGGPEGGSGNEGDPWEKEPEKEKEKPCKFDLVIHQVNESELPKPDWVYTVSVDIFIQGDDEKCNAEGIMFTLFDVSKERGRYMNDKERYDDLEEDLQMSDLNSDYTITKTTASKHISGKNQTQQIHIFCRDYGAFGKLKASVKVKGQWYEADADGTPDKFVTIPLDLNDNKISDSWEKQNGVYDKPGEWDEDSNPKGQASNGDGMTNYEEYRGFMVDDGSGVKEHKRTNPMQKEIFVIDEKQKFDVAAWKSASGITAYWLTNDLVFGDKGGGLKDLQYRRVDFCYGNAAGEKYAINLIVADGIISSECGASGDINVWGCSWGPPKFAEVTVVFPDRMRAMLKDFKDSLAVWKVRFPNGFMLGSINVTPAKADKFIAAMNNPAKFDEMVNYSLNLTIIHEVGHACGIPHHCLTQTSSGECIRTGGVNSCPMSYAENGGFLGIFSRLEGIMKLIDKNENLMVSYTSSKFCKTQDKCFTKLQVNDRLNYLKIPLN
ncbi:MAG: hypothetical protein L0Y77_09475 [Chlorobi bacterium]|nr:hypothetical protein [Chlorobiota bacterium]